MSAPAFAFVFVVVLYRILFSDVLVIVLRSFSGSRPCPRTCVRTSFRFRVCIHVRDRLLIRYFKVLIQEMDTRVDMGFLTALMELFSSDTIDKSLEVRSLARLKKYITRAVFT